MKLNLKTELCAPAQIFLDEKDMVSDGHCLGADEEAGTVLMVKRTPEGQAASRWNALPGALIYDDQEVEILTGNVRIGVDPATTKHLDADSLRETWERSYSPIQILRLTGEGLEAAFTY